MNQEQADAIVLKEYNDNDEKFTALSYNCTQCDNMFWFAISEYDDMTEGDMHDCFIGSSVNGKFFKFEYCIECRKRTCLCNDHCDEWEYICDDCEPLYLPK